MVRFEIQYFAQNSFRVRGFVCTVCCMKHKEKELYTLSICPKTKVRLKAGISSGHEVNGRKHTGAGRCQGLSPRWFKEGSDWLMEKAAHHHLSL